MTRVPLSGPGEVWADGTGDRDYGEAGEGALDRAAGDCDGHVEEEQREGELAVVHLYFCFAAVMASYVPRYVPQSTELFSGLYRLGRAALTVVLFLIGTGITRNTLKEVGVRPLIQGVALWIVVGSLSLWAIHAGWIAL